MNTAVAEVTTHDAAPVAPTADPMVSLIESLVTNPDADLDKLERFMEMQERREAQQAKRAFDAAISAAKAELPEIGRDGVVDYKNTKGQRVFFRHETMSGIAKLVDPVLSKHGLSYRYRSEQKDGGVSVTCIIAHRDGYSEETTLHGAPDTSGSKNSYQAVGSTVTYLQRYTLKLALGLTAAQDTDGIPPEPPVEAWKVQQVRDRMAKIGIEEQVILDAERIADLDNITEQQFETVMDQLAITAKQRGIEL